MKLMRWAAAVFLLAGLSSFAYAQVPDGGVGVKHSLNSLPITTLSGGLTFTPCSPTPSEPDLATDCSTYGAQAVFAGVNETGVGWSNLSITYSGWNQSMDPSVNCDGSTFFQHCTIVDATDCATSTVCSFTANFTQGNGSGVGCYNFSLSSNDPTNAACLTNSGNTAASNIVHTTSDPYYNPLATYTAGIGCTYGPTLPAYPPGAICGPSDFALTIGGTGINFNAPLSNDVTYAAATPEPQTLLLVGAAMLGMMFIATRKKRLLA